MVGAGRSRRAKSENITKVLTPLSRINTCPKLIGKFYRIFGYDILYNAFVFPSDKMSGWLRRIGTTISANITLARCCHFAQSREAKQCEEHVHTEHPVIKLCLDAMDQRCVMTAM